MKVLWLKLRSRFVSPIAIAICSSLYHDEEMWSIHGVREPGWSASSFIRPVVSLSRSNRNTWQSFAAAVMTIWLLTSTALIAF